MVGTDRSWVSGIEGGPRIPAEHVEFVRCQYRFTMLGRARSVNWSKGVTMSVLIVTMPNDYHAQAVKWAIQKLGGSCTVFYPFDLSGGAQWTLDPDDDVLRIAYRGERAELRFGDFESVWMRRPPSRFPQEHIVDPRERGSSEGECAMFAASVLTRLEAGRFTVSPIDATQRASL